MFVKGYDFRTFGFINTKVLFKMRSPGNETTTLSMCCDVSIHRNGYFGEFEPSRNGYSYLFTNFGYVGLNI